MFQSARASFVSPIAVSLSSLSRCNLFPESVELNVRTGSAVKSNLCVTICARIVQHCATKCEKNVTTPFTVGLLVRWWMRTTRIARDWLRVGGVFVARTNVTSNINVAVYLVVGKLYLQLRGPVTNAAARLAVRCKHSLLVGFMRLLHFLWARTLFQRKGECNLFFFAL